MTILTFLTIKDIKVEITLSIVHKYHGQKGQNDQWSSVQKDMKVEMKLSIVHQYYGQKGQNGQWSSVQKDIEI